ncbi:ATP-dependent DNA helicase RecG [bacterium]|nr:ATP-dependent DNA helicase RecG [bacterium]
MNEFLNSEITYLKGVGETRAKILQTELGIRTFEDLLMYFPFRYEDRSKFSMIKDVVPDAGPYQIKGRILSKNMIGFQRNSRLSAIFSDGKEETELVWFKGVQWLNKSLKTNEEVVLYGKANSFNGKLNFPHPEIISLEEAKKNSGLYAIYSLTERMRKSRIDSKSIRGMMSNLLDHEKLDIPEILPSWILEKYKLLSRAEAFRQVHRPNSTKQSIAARQRFKFEELFFLQFPFIHQRINRSQAKEGLVFEKNMPLFQEFIEQHIPFDLTGAQTRVLQEIKTDLCSGKQMNRLLQGDVGSGKTIVAFLSMLMAIDSGYQCSLMAPTEILASQHYIGLKQLAEKQNIPIALLTGSTSAAERKEIHRLLKLGEIKILIGTHALIEDKVQIPKQGLVVIDEQHRFGVAQRAKLQAKGGKDPHVLVMTATPIPRTLAMSVYGDLDYSVIDELPKGRKTIKTVHRFGFARPKVWEFIRSAVDAGKQAYIVYPLIEESDNFNYKDLNNGYDELLKAFPRPKYQVDMLHGQMNSEDKEAVMKRFKDKGCQILVSTTVIEVGIDVPNASIMVIESAEKFGLSQLHQLRGRVGRGADQSYCILMSSKKLSENAEIRLKAMVKRSSGFELSEIDMQLRGFGDISGTRQSGLDQLKLASLSEDRDIALAARTSLEHLFTEDPELKLPQQQGLRRYLEHRNGFEEWSKIA